MANAMYQEGHRTASSVPCVSAFRPARVVVVRPARVAWRVAPAVFLPVVLWTGVVVATAPARGRKVDHVRMVARAKSDEARIVLKMEK